MALCILRKVEKLHNNSCRIQVKGLQPGLHRQWAPSFLVCFCPCFYPISAITLCEVISTPQLYLGNIMLHCYCYSVICILLLPHMSEEMA